MVKSILSSFGAVEEKGLAHARQASCRWWHHLTSFCFHTIRFHLPEVYSTLHIWFHDV